MTSTQNRRRARTIRPRRRGLGMGLRMSLRLGFRRVIEREDFDAPDGGRPFVRERTADRPARRSGTVQSPAISSAGLAPAGHVIPGPSTAGG
jgi:hypothetical protein